MERSREAEEGEEARKYGNEPDPFDIMYGDASHRYADTKLKTRASTRDTWITGDFVMRETNSVNVT